MNATHQMSITIEVEVDADHEEDCVPVAQAVWLRMPEGARLPVRIDAAGRKWIDIADLVLIDSQRDAWGDIEVELKAADARVLDSEPHTTEWEPA